MGSFWNLRDVFCLRQNRTIVLCDRLFLGALSVSLQRVMLIEGRSFVLLSGGLQPRGVLLEKYKKTGLDSQGMTEEPGEFSKQYNSRIM